MVENHLSAQQREEEEAATVTSGENVEGTIVDRSVIQGAVQPGIGMDEAEGNVFEV